MNERRRERLFWGLLASELALFVAWQSTHLGGFQWGSDEGVYLMRVRLMQQGYHLYKDIWTDQLPGFIELLRLAFALLGTSIQVGRAAVVLLTTVGLFSTAALTRQLGGRTGALAVTPLLALSPNFYWLSRAMVSPDLPSISVGIAGLAMMGCYTRTYRPGWLILSGLAFAAGLYIKATAILALAPAALWLLMSWQHSSGRAVRALFRRILVWGAAISLPLGLALSFHALGPLWTQFVGTQVASGQMKLKIAPHALKILAYLSENHWGLAFLAVAGALGALGRRRVGALLPLAWLATSVVVLLIRSPLWPSHHLVVLLPPLALLSGLGISRLWEHLHQRKLRADGLAVVVAIILYLIGLPGIIAADSELSAARTFRTSLEAVDFLRDRFPSGAVVISDYHMIPFRAGCSVPPELATVTKKRIQLGMLTSDDLIHITQESQPEAVILWDEQLTRATEYVDWLKRHYVLAFKRNYHQIYVPLPPQAIRHPQVAFLGGVVCFRGYDLQTAAVDPGDMLEVTLYWRALEPISQRYYGFLHLLTPDGQQVAQEDHLAWGEQYPSTMWQVGETIVDRYQVDIPADTSSGRYLLSVGLYEKDTKRRLEVRDSHGQQLAGNQVALGVQPVVRWPAQYKAPDVSHPANVRLGQVARLVGYDLSTSEGALVVRLVWEALSPPEWPGYTVFVHLRDGERLVTQHDGPPGEGQRPTFGWRPREFVSDQHTLPLSDGADGSYHLFVGMYDPATGQRLPVYDATGTLLPSGEVLLGQVTVGGAG